MHWGDGEMGRETTSTCHLRTVVPPTTTMIAGANDKNPASSAHPDCLGDSRVRSSDLVYGFFGLKDPIIECSR